jgi:hypothetical protein
VLHILAGTSLFVLNCVPLRILCGLQYHSAVEVHRGRVTKICRDSMPAGYSLFAVTINIVSDNSLEVEVEGELLKAVEHRSKRRGRSFLQPAIDLNLDFDNRDTSRWQTNLPYRNYGVAASQARQIHCDSLSYHSPWDPVADSQIDNLKAWMRLINR